MKRKYKISFDSFSFNNRWCQPRYSRNSDWIVLGFGIWLSGPGSFCWRFSFFGIELKVWFKRTWKG